MYRSFAVAQDDSGSFCMTFGCSVLHVIRDALVVMLSEAKHLSHPFVYYHPFFLSYCHFARASHCHFDRARPIVMLSGAKHLSHYFSSVISTERSEWRNLYASCARHRRRNIRSPTTTVRRCGELDPEGLSSRLAVA